jgi:hypothetical protein
MRMTSNRSVGDGAAGGAKRRNRRNHAAVRRHAGLVRHDGARLGEQRDIAVVHVAAMRREEARPEKAVPIEKCRRTDAVVLDHEVDLGAALREVNRVAEIVLVGKRADGPEQLG